MGADKNRMNNKKEGFVDSVNLDFYENHFSDVKAIHRYPNVNTVRCEMWYFRKNLPPGKILDYGFGYGQEAIYFAENGYEVYGLEISQKALSNVKKMISEKYPHLSDRINLSIIDDSDKRLPFENNFFNFIHSNQTIYHLPSEAAIRKLISEWHRVLKPGGRIMFSTVGPESFPIVGATEIKKNLYEKEFKTPGMNKSVKMRSFLMRDEDTIRDFCEPLFEIDEIGWFTNHYCGIDGFHWQILAKKP